MLPWTLDSATGDDDPGDPSQRGRAGSEPSRKPRVQTEEIEIQAGADGLGSADWSSWDIKKSLKLLRPENPPSCTAPGTYATPHSLVSCFSGCDVEVDQAGLLFSRP